ncbi:MAG: ABC transporter ATP-binding protein, partial [Patescibacteria group bacterium]
FKDAPVLILDEPTSALDPKSEYDVFHNLISHTTHKSLILISHRFSTVRIADEIVVMHKGEIVEQGTHEELMKLAGRYAKLYNLQAKWYK